MDKQGLQDLARHQVWADGLHWKALRENAALGGDAEIRKRLNHMLAAMKMLTGLARGESPNPASFKEVESLEQLEAAMGQAHQDLAAALESLDLEKMITLPRGPQGSFPAPAGMLLLQAITHSQHHRGQNASRMRQLGTTPPMTDYILWYAQGRP